MAGDRRGARATAPRGRAAADELLVRGTTDHYEDAALYDHEYSDRGEDLRWYRRIARSRSEGGPILELGAGTGRISLPLAQDGHRVLALDRMPAMLDRLRERASAQPFGHRITTMEGDMRQLPCEDASIPLVFAPFNTLMHLYTWQDILACFRDVARVLRPGGTFAFDVELPDLEWLRWDPKARHAVTRFVHPVTRERLVYSTNHTYDDATQICHVRIYYDDAPPAGRRFEPPSKPRKLVHLAHREIFPEEVRMFVALAGLELESHTGDFVDRTLGRGVQSQVVVCTRPGA
jgi:ubiquinone/menaquinone biosynthesis C-methylase UbiE